MKTIVRLTVLFVTLAGSALAEDQNQHRRPDDIKQYLEHLDSTERDRYQKPSEVIDALKLKPGMAVADLGSGSGYFTRRFIEAVTETGMVYAVDVEPEMLAYAKESVIHMHTAYTAEFILAQPDNPKLPFASVDLLFICNTIHHLGNRSKYFSDLKSSLKAGARIAIIDFYPDERSGDLGFPKHHLVARDTIVQEMAAAGYQLAREHGFLQKQYFLEFTPK
ncbi:MAG: methyltransferase domain-containing protein [Nitrospira sp.]